MKKNHKDKFKTPEGYFNSFNDRLLDKIAQEESIIPKSDGFSVPQGYFKDIHPSVLNKLDKRVPKVIALKNYTKYFYVAASVAAIFLLVVTLLPKQSQTPQFDDLASTEIENYFEDTEIGLTSYEIAQVVAFNGEELETLAEEELEEALILDYIDTNTDTFDELNLDYEFEE